MGVQIHHVRKRGQATPGLTVRPIELELDQCRTAWCVVVLVCMCVAPSSSGTEKLQYFLSAAFNSLASAESETLVNTKISLKSHPRLSTTKATCFIWLGFFKACCLEN